MEFKEHFSSFCSITIMVILPPEDEIQNSSYNQFPYLFYQKHLVFFALSIKWFFTFPS